MDRLRRWLRRWLADDSEGGCEQEPIARCRWCTRPMSKREQQQGCCYTCQLLGG